MTISLLGICGSLRAGSSNRKLLNAALVLFGPAKVTDADLRLPLYDGDLEDREGIPAGVQQLATQMIAADGVIFACPEYNRGVPGVLKNALDWVSRVKGGPLRDKPVALLSAADGPAGGARAQYALRLNLVPFRADVLAGPEILLPSASQAFDDQGQLLNARTATLVGELMGELRAGITRRRD